MFTFEMGNLSRMKHSIVQTFVVLFFVICQMPDVLKQLEALSLSTIYDFIRGFAQSTDSSTTENE